MLRTMTHIYEASRSVLVRFPDALPTWRPCSVCQHVYVDVGICTIWPGPHKVPKTFQPLQLYVELHCDYMCMVICVTWVHWLLKLHGHSSSRLVECDTQATYIMSHTFCWVCALKMNRLQPLQMGDCSSAIGDKQFHRQELLLIKG